MKRFCSSAPGCVKLRQGSFLMGGDGARAVRPSCENAGRKTGPTDLTGEQAQPMTRISFFPRYIAWAVSWRTFKTTYVP